MKNLKKVLAWCSYDLANTAFSALFITFFFPLFIKVYLGGNEFHIGLTFGISMLLVGLIVPIIGSISDIIKNRMKFLIFFTIITIISTILIGFSKLTLSLIIGGIANFAYHAALTFYNSLMPTLTHKSKLGKLSGYGVAAGYFGTILSLIMTFIILNKIGWESKQSTIVMFIATAIFFLIFSIPTFIFIKEKNNKKDSIKKNIKKGWKHFISTFYSLKKHKSAILFFIGIFMYTNAINAATIFLYLYGRQEIGLTIKGFMIVFLVFSIAAVIGSSLIGHLSDYIGHKKTLILTGIFWIVVIITLINVKTYNTFLFAGCLGGIAMGAVWTASRPLLINLAPKNKIGQFFGFTELTDKFSGVLGPIVFGYFATFNYTYALYSLLIFFIIGIIFMIFVNEK